MSGDGEARTSLTGLEIRGDLVAAGEAGWDEARAAWNLAVDQQPLAVALAADADDVATVVSFAAAHGLRVAPQGTGHGASPLPPLEGTILLKTERLRGVSVDPAAGTARVEAGVLSAELAEAAQAHGLAPLGGSSPDVGVVGYTLGGGLGWLGRRHGFACNAVRSIELVTAAGERRTVDAERDPDLFWALRGGGGSGAVVTALEIDLVAVEEVYAGALVFPAELGAAAFRAFREWCATVPDEVTAIARLLRPPPIPDVPEPLRDRPLITIDAAFLGSAAEGEALMAPLRALGEPILDSFATIPAAGLSRIHMDPEQPVPGLGNHLALAELPDEAIDAFLAAGPGPGNECSLLSAELRHLGGALGRAPGNAGALAKLDFPFVLVAIGMPIPPERAAAVRADLDRIVGDMAPWAADGGYLNFAERPCGVDAILPPDVCARLTEVLDRWDPQGTILAAHTVGLDAAS